MHLLVTHQFQLSGLDHQSFSCSELNHNFKTKLFYYNCHTFSLLTIKSAIISRKYVENLFIVLGLNVCDVDSSSSLLVMHTSLSTCLQVQFCWVKAYTSSMNPPEAQLAVPQHRALSYRNPFFTPSTPKIHKVSFY